MGIRIIDAGNYRKALNSLPNVAGKRDATILLDMVPTIDPETLPLVQELRKQLEQVTAERDAAVRDIERALAHGPGYNICMLCKKTQGSIQCKSTLCLPEWRGPVAENTASESEAKNHAAD